MHNLFIYETPHPAFLAFAKSIDCVIPSSCSISKPDLPGVLTNNKMYRWFARLSSITKHAIEMNTRDYLIPDNFKSPDEPDIVLYEGWRQMGLTKYFPDSYNVLINGDWYPLVFHKNKKMMEYYNNADLIITVCDHNKKHLPESVQNRTRVVHPSFDLEPIGRSTGGDCIFIGNVYEKVKRVDLSIKLFKKAFGENRKVCFHIIGQGNKKTGEFGNICYWGGLYRNNKFNNIILSSKYYLHWGKCDPHPVTVMETMSCGIIPITSPDVGNHYITKKIIGDLGDCSTMDGVVKIIKIIENDNDLAEELRTKCIDLSSDYKPEFTMETFRSVVMEEYRKWIGY